MHCVLEFNQSQWLKPYAEFNLQKRIKAKKTNNNNSNKKQGQRLKSNIKINEQCYAWQNNEKCEN